VGGTHGGDRPDEVVAALGVPGGDTRVQQGVGDREVELGVLVDALATLARHGPGEQVPVTGWLLGIGPVGPVLGPRLGPVIQLGAEADDGLDRLVIGAVALLQARPGGRNWLAEASANCASVSSSSDTAVSAASLIRRQTRQIDW
jgi:hypothetical protein